MHKFSLKITRATRCVFLCARIGEAERSRGKAFRVEIKVKSKCTHKVSINTVSNQLFCCLVLRSIGLHGRNIGPPTSGNGANSLSKFVLIINYDILLFRPDCIACAERESDEEAAARVVVVVFNFVNPTSVAQSSSCS